MYFILNGIALDFSFVLFCGGSESSCECCNRRNKLLEANKTFVPVRSYSHTQKIFLITAVSSSKAEN